MGDEVIYDYTFKWNITGVSAWIEVNLNQVELSTVQVNFPSPGVDSENLNEEFIPRADLTRPIIIERMRTDSFRLIEGNHRVEKARRLAVNKFPAYYLTELKHRQFFTFDEADRIYVDYWNDKLKKSEKDGDQWIMPEV